MKSPIEYRLIPTQYAFLVSEDGTLQIKQMTDVPKTMKFASEQEAREFIKEYKVQY